MKSACALVLGCVLASLAACKRHDYQHYLTHELGFVQLGVQLASEEKEVRRVLAQRGLRVVARLDNPTFIALGAATRDGSKSAVRVVSRRGVVVAEDAALDDLFAPSRVSLIEHFGGEVGESLLVAHARAARAQDAACVTLERVLPDGAVVRCVLDVSMLGSRACVSNLAPGRNGHVRAQVAWPGLHALSTPELDVELAFVEPRLGQASALIPVAHIAVGPWLDQEASRLSTLRLGRAEFSQRHAAGVARAAVARLTGKDTATQVAAYRNAVAEVLPGTTEAEIVADTAGHIQRQWLDADSAPAPEQGAAPTAAPVEPAPALAPDEEVIEGPAPPAPPSDEPAVPSREGDRDP